MIKGFLFSCVLVFCVGSTISESYQTHISEPIIVSDKFNYSPGEKITVLGVVYYNEESTSDVLLKIVAINPSGQEVFEEYVTSEVDGTFLTVIPVKPDAEIGNYEIKATSQCREIHREICTHQYETISIAITQELEQNNGVPKWIKNNAGWWASGEINDATFLQGMEYLIENGILVTSPSQTSNASETQDIPTWIKNNAGWWASGEINDATFLQGMEYLIENGIIMQKNSQ